jgi:hypothetical protein
MVMAWFSSLWQRAKARIAPAQPDPLVPGAPPPHGATSEPVKRKRRWWLAAAPAALLAVLLYYVLGALLLTQIDTNPAFRPAAADLPPKGSVAVAMASAVMNREVNDHGWKPNNPFFFPTALMDNMPAYQSGQLLMVRQFLLELKDHVGRLRGMGATDSDLDSAYSALSYPPDIWLIGTRWPFIGASSESFYRDAIEHMRTYNGRVATGDALYERRVDTLGATLNRMALSIGDASANAERTVSAGRGGLFDTGADDVFYQNKGQAYAAYLLLTGLREDYADVIRQRQLTNLWTAMMDSLRQVIEMDPLIVSNGDPDALFSANHLTTQNTYLLTARNRLREITTVLQQ